MNGSKLSGFTNGNAGINWKRKDAQLLWINNVGMPDNDRNHRACAGDFQSQKPGGRTLRCITWLPAMRWVRRLSLTIVVCLIPVNLYAFWRASDEEPREAALRRALALAICCGSAVQLSLIRD